MVERYFSIQSNHKKNRYTISIFSHSTLSHKKREIQFLNGLYFRGYMREIRSHKSALLPGLFRIYSIGMWGRRKKPICIEGWAPHTLCFPAGKSGENIRNISKKKHRKNTCGKLNTGSKILRCIHARAITEEASSYLISD